MADNTLAWRHPSPFILPWSIEADVIDHYNHVNNVAYISQLERTAWAHSNSLGLDIGQYQALDRGMAIRRHEVDYLAAALLRDQIHCATWIVKCDRRLQLTREFQFIRQRDGVTVFNGRTEFICIALSSGKPKRMPALFADTYGNACITTV